MPKKHKWAPTEGEGRGGTEGDPLRFAFVLQKLVSSLDAYAECAEILLAWYHNNGVLAATCPAVLLKLN